MQYYDPKHGDGVAPPAYDDTYYPTPPRGDRDSGIRQVQTKVPWWNPRYWRKRVWIGLSIVLVIIITIAVAVGVTQAKKANAYPNYSELNYSLKETCWSLCAR